MWIPDPLLGRIESVSINPHFGLPHFGSWFLKAKYTTINEVAAYQFAIQVGVKVPESKWFVIRKPFELDSHRLIRGDVGMLIEPVLDPLETHYAELAQSAPTEMARIYALWTFLRSEVGEIWPTKRGIFVLDLEFAFARFESTAKSRASRLADYVDGTREMICYATEQASVHSIESTFREELRRICDYSLGAKLNFDFSPHPRKQVVETFLHVSLRKRVQQVVEWMRF